MRPACKRELGVSIRRASQVYEVDTSSYSCRLRRCGQAVLEKRGTFCSYVGARCSLGERYAGLSRPGCYTGPDERCITR